MALSNTAVPKYYGMFRDAVIRGEIPKGIENFLTGSIIEIRLMSINKLQGLRVKDG